MSSVLHEARGFELKLCYGSFRLEDKKRITNTRPNTGLGPYTWRSYNTANTTALLFVSFIYNGVTVPKRHTRSQQEPLRDK